MWYYEQASGLIYQDRLKPLWQGYAGHGLGLNNPAMQDQHDVGPPCRNTYTIEAPVDTATHGKFVLWLTPHDQAKMFGRFGFGMHDDRADGSHFLASTGCIILPRWVREAVWNSGDHVLVVI